MATKIKSLEELKTIANEETGMTDCFITLGGMRSSKAIMWVEDEQKFYITNEIDDSEQELTCDQMLDTKLTHIGEAIKNGNFYA